MAAVIKDIDEFHKLAAIVEIFHNIEVRNSRAENSSMKERLDPSRLAPQDYRTMSGYFLQLHECHPIALWTPWGNLDLKLSRNLDWQKLLPEILTQLSTKETCPRCHNFIGMFGPVYALRKVGKQKLPKAVLLPFCKILIDRMGQDPTRFAEVDEDRYPNMTKEVWNTLCTHYCFAHKL